MIRKDVNDALNNLKKESPEKTEKKQTKSKFDNMSPDELLKEINKGNDTKPGVRKLKRISPDVQKKAPQPSGKKRIVIGELPDYDAIEKQQTAVSEEDVKIKDVAEESPEKQTENKKGFFSRVKDLMYVSAEDDEENSVEESKVEETSGNDENFTIEEIEESTAKTLESISEAMAEINGGVEEKEPVQENEPEKPSEQKPSEQAEEPVKTPENKQSNNSGKRKKKKKKKNSGNKPKENQSVTELEVKPEKTEPEIKPEEPEQKAVPEEIQSVTEPEETIETVQEEESQEENVSDEKTEETVTGKDEHSEKSGPVRENKGKYNILGLVCVILAIVGVVAIISTCISNIGGSKSSKKKFARAVYPAVIMNINPFENPSELPNDQILSAAIWSVIIDDNKLSKYPERMGVVTIPAVDIENFAFELFGEDIPELVHTTVGSVESKFYYNTESQSYNIQVKPDTFTYSPEVTSVFRKDGKYIVNVDYIEEHPEWMDKSVSKTVQFRLSKNNDGGYKIDSMEVESESSST